MKCKELSIWTLSATVDRERIRELLAKAFAGEISHFEIQSKGPRGRIFKSCFVPIKNKNGGLERLMGITEDITEQKQAEEHIRQLAFYDALTQLPNRRLYSIAWNRRRPPANGQCRYVALMFLDLDNFKPLNDTHGHDVGDLLLIEVAHRITPCVREMDTVARFGGDEFVVILGELDVDEKHRLSKQGLWPKKSASPWPSLIY